MRPATPAQYELCLPSSCYRSAAIDIQLARSVWHNEARVLCNSRSMTCSYYFLDLLLFVQSRCVGSVNSLNSAS